MKILIAWIRAIAHDWFTDGFHPATLFWHDNTTKNRIGCFTCDKTFYVYPKDK